MTKPTSGPWYAEGSCVYREWDGKGRRIMDCFAPVWHEDYRKGLDEAEANARLVAAAPELFKSLSALLEAVITDHKMDNKSIVAVSEAYDAILKAEGNEK